MKIVREFVGRRRRTIPLICLIMTISLTTGCGKTDVQVVTPQRGEIRESFTESARTRLTETYPISMPVTGRIGRIDPEPGDTVKKGEILVEFDRLPLEKEVEEARALVAELQAEIEVNKDNRIEKTAIVETEAAIEAAQEALKAANEQVDAERARAERTEKHRQRMLMLSKTEAIPQSKLDDANLAADTALIELRRQQFYRSAFNALMVAIRLGPQYVNLYVERKLLSRKVIKHQLEQARAKLERAEHNLELARITSPINGVVLKRYNLGDSTLPAGRDLLLLGDPDLMEVIADVLTQDALKLKPGGPVELRPATGTDVIRGRVKRIEPAGFTKVSSLGVEQQRVNVIVKFGGAHDGLGVGYRVRARFVTGSKDDALIVPRFSVLQAPDRTYYVFTVERGRLRKQPIELGLRNDLELEVVGGLSEKDRIVARPTSAMTSGMKVKARN